MKPKCYNCKHAKKIDSIGKLNRACCFGDSENELRSHLQTCEHHEYSEAAKNRMFWMEKLNKLKKIEYGKTQYGVFVINRETLLTRTPTVVFVWDARDNLEVKYNYDCEANTYEDDSFQLITKSEFNHIIKQIKARYNVNFTIKLR